MMLVLKKYNKRFALSGIRTTDLNNPSNAVSRLLKAKKSNFQLIKCLKNI